MPNYVGVSVCCSFILTSFFTSLTLSKISSVEENMLKKIRELEQKYDSNTCSNNNTCNLRN